MRPDIYQDPYRNIVRKQRCAAVAHKRQRYPYNRHDAQGHANVYKKVNTKHEGNAEGKEPAEVVLCLSGGIQSAQYEQ